jgi:hypothetical protein
MVLEKPTPERCGRATGLKTAIARSPTDRVIDATVDLAFALPLKLRRSRLGLIACSPILVILALPLAVLLFVWVLVWVFNADRKTRE